ncbi:hypothetical protein [Desulfosoma sp.]
MDERTVRLCLFPHSVLPDAGARCLFSVWSPLECLRAVEPASIPEWAEPRCAQHVLEQSEKFWDRVRAVLQGYRELGSRVGEDGLMAVLSRDWALDAGPESRGHIQSILKGISPETPQLDEWLLTEAAVFLELGRELDIRELELSKNLEHVGRLEENLLKALGADEEDTAELQKALETTNPPLSPDWGHFGYLLRQRIGYWFRMCRRTRVPHGRVVLVALGRDVVDEALDPVQTERERRREPWDRGEMLLLTCPRTDLLSPEDLTRWLDAVENLEARGPFQKSLEAFMEEPSRDVFRKDLVERARDVEEALQTLWSQFRGDLQGLRGYGCVLTAPREVTTADVWRAVDRTGAEALGTGSFDRAPALFMHLESPGVP